MDSTSIIIAVIAAIPGIFAFISGIRRDRNDAKKTEIEATDVAQKSVQVLLEPLNKRIADLEDIGKECKMKVLAFERIVGQKDVRIRELEAVVADKDRRISDMQREIDELRERVNVLERNGNGGKK